MNLRDQLQESLSDTAINKLSNRFRIIGDIAIVSIPPEMSDYKWMVSEALIASRRNIKTVLNKVSKLDGDRRVADFEVLAGKDTVTEHKELGYSYRLDVCKVFFNSSLTFERRRIALMTMPGEQVLIPFCGVGPFAVPVAARGAKVVAVESNSEACKWMAENTRLNGVEDNISIINGDAFLIPRMIKLSFDRAIIPTPYGRDDILEIVSPVVKKGGLIHFYTFKKRHQIEGLIEIYRSMNFEVQFYRRSGNVAPGVSRWAFDLMKL
ncbi:MAG: class I SAM-dependent methyltransferase family protein [Methanotrichaceae archaeon]